MKRISFTILLLFGCMLACFAAAIITGTWKGVLIANDGNSYTLTYNFKTEGNKLTGTVDSPMGQFDIEDGVISGDSIKFKVEANGKDVPHAGRCYADSITLDMKNDDDLTYHFTLKPADR